MLEKFHNHPLKNLNTFGFDVNARYFIKAHSEEDILQIIQNTDLKNNPLLIIGGGSNLLFTKNFDGTILQPLMQNIDVEEEEENSVLLRVGAGVIWDNFVRHCVSKNLYGIENLSLIPGMVGASPVQNIGAYGVEAKDTIEKVQYIDIQSLHLKTLDNEQCRFDYRNSIFKQELKGKTIITQVFFRLLKKSDLKLEYGNLHEAVPATGGATLQHVREAVVAIRRNKLPDPAEIGNAGSFFKNPFVAQPLAEKLLAQYPNMPTYPAQCGVKIPAGWLIEQCGFKGARCGHVGVHPKQALVLVNYGGGTGSEVLTLAKEICEAVHKKFNVKLEMEVNIV